MAAPDFITNLLQLGVGGIDLKSSIDLIKSQRVARLTNLCRDEIGRLQTRLGQRRFAWTPGEEVHSIARIQKVLAGGEFRRLAGVGTELYSGVDGALGLLTAGFSGQPLTVVAGHPPLSGDSWAYIFDSVKLCKVRASDDLVTPLGFPAPTAAAIVATIEDQDSQQIELFNTATWTNNAGTGAAGTNSHVVSLDGNEVAFIADPGAAPGAYYNFWSKAVSPSIDMTKLALHGVSSVTLVPATDDDEVTLAFQLAPRSNLDLVTALRVYFVISPGFDLTVLPGSSATINTDYYMHEFNPATLFPPGELTPGAGSWSQYGAFGGDGRGLPLRRGQFARGGTDPTLNWSTVTGLVIYLSMNTNTAAQVGFADQGFPPVHGMVGGLRLMGGYNLDNLPSTSLLYDWIYRHFDPRTGAKGRYSPVQTSGTQANRQEIALVPQAYGDPAVRQEFFRRGGTLAGDWYYVGVNTSDGGLFMDNTSDVEARASGAESEDDFHQPITTVDLAGNAVYAQPIPIAFGPAPGAGILIGLGDPYRPGNIYWTLPDQYDHWPLGNTLEVCSPAEELMNGGIFGGQAFCFSRARLYGLLVSIVDGKMQAQPTLCAKGLVSRWAMAIGLDAIYFVAPDGVWTTTGGTPQNISSELLEPLFSGVVKNGYAPINFEAAHHIRLSLFNNELWLLFEDVNGDRQCWVYSLLFSFWRHYEFGWGVTTVVGEDQDQLLPQLLMGAAESGRIYVHDGAHDDGLAISSQVRTGALNQGMPRAHKLYGDVELEADLQGVVATVEIFADLESRTLTPVVVPPQAGPKVYLIDAFGSTPLLAKDVSIDISWDSFGVRPWIGRCGPSAVPQPEASIRRMTEWDNLGAATNKWIKGVLIEADTFGFVKQLSVMVDGATTPVTTFTLQTLGRQFKHIAFDSQVDARTVRLTPTDGNPWIPYEIRWVFDQDPLELVRWETQEIDHGIPDEQTLLWAYVTLRSSAVVHMEVQVRRADGTTTTGTVAIPSTGGAKQKAYVTLPVLKGLLFKYTFTSADSSPFRLFREESSVFLQPWGGDAPVPVQPFGTDALDQMRFVRDAEGAALRGQKYLSYGGAPDAGTGGNAG